MPEQLPMDNRWNYWTSRGVLQLEGEGLTVAVGDPLTELG